MGDQPPSELRCNPHDLLVAVRLRPERNVDLLEQRRHGRPGSARIRRGRIRERDAEDARARSGRTPPSARTSSSRTRPSSPSHGSRRPLRGGRDGDRMKDVDLPPLGMTQINRVAAALGATTLDAGRITVSTPTRGRPRRRICLGHRQRRRTTRGRCCRGTYPAGLNLLVNPGFDRDLGGWTGESQILPNPAGGKASLIWTATDVAGDPASGGVTLRAEAPLFGSAAISLSQCVAVSEGFFVSFGAKFFTASQAFSAGTSIDVTFFASTDCSGAPLGIRVGPTSLPSDPLSDLSSNGL